RNLFERTILLETGDVVEPQHLKLAPRSRATAGAETAASIGQRVDAYLNGALSDDGIPFEPLIEELERALIVRASCATKWNQSRTAELLHLKRDKLRYRMKIYQLQTEDGTPAPQE